MKYSRSVNIERDFDKSINYIVTANSKKVASTILASFQQGIHSFTLIGSYGTGKSSFILEFYKSLKAIAVGTEQTLISQEFISYLEEFKRIETISLVGGYSSLSSILAGKLDLSSETTADEVLLKLKSVIKSNRQKGALTVLSIDEFGKTLEYASNNQPEEEMYFLQQLSELINDVDTPSILITTLHQSFEAYSNNLSYLQRQEWTKVKGRFLDIVFLEPVEQLLNLTARRIQDKFKGKLVNKSSARKLYDLAIKSNFLNTSLTLDTCYALYPMDIFSATIMTLANQQYGQNERTLFTFLESKEELAITRFTEESNLNFYSLPLVYDYLVQAFHDSLSHVHKYSTGWAAIKNAIDRVWGYYTDTQFIIDSIKIIKTIGLLNIFSSSTTKVGEAFISTYAIHALGISDSREILRILKHDNIIRFANYKNKYILFEGSDFDIEQALREAEKALPQTTKYVSLLQAEVKLPLELANAHFYKTGSPRCYEYVISEEPLDTDYLSNLIYKETDGIINIVLSPLGKRKAIESTIKSVKGAPYLYCLYYNVEEVVKHAREIEKINWILKSGKLENTDKVARDELLRQISYEKEQLRHMLTREIFNKQYTKWFFDGRKITNIHSSKSLIKFLSKLSDIVYSATPTFKNELVNKHKPSGNITTARQTLLQALIEHEEYEDIGFAKDKYPPEKSIYLSLIKNTGIHAKMSKNSPLYQLTAPKEQSYQKIWKTCCDFLISTTSASRKLSELHEILSKPPFGLKLGFLDFWLPLFLIVKKEEYVLYANGRYVPFLNKEVLELIQKAPEDFSIKAFYIAGFQLDVFNNYRKAINLGQEQTIRNKSFIETIRPFLIYYNKLNKYTQNTAHLSPAAIKFRDVIKVAKDPVQTFFEDLPNKLGFNEVELAKDPKVVDTFVDVLREAMRDIQEAYPRLIDLVESTVLATLGIKETKYLNYREQINSRFSELNHNLIPQETKRFIERLTTLYDDKEKWIESITYVFLRRPFDTVKDSEIDYVLDSIKKNLIALDDYIILDNLSTERAYRLHITSSKDGFVDSQVVIDETNESELTDVIGAIEEVLSKNERINIAALASVLREKIKQNE